MHTTITVSMSGTIIKESIRFSLRTAATTKSLVLAFEDAGEGKNVRHQAYSFAVKRLHAAALEDRRKPYMGPFEKLL